MREGERRNGQVNPSGPDFADRDVSTRKIIWFCVGVTLFAVAAALFLRWLFFAFERQARQAEEVVSAYARDARILPPEPRLQVDEAGTWAREQARQKALISGYAWVDPGRGVVRIPVDRAMDILAERGLPARAEEGLP